MLAENKRHNAIRQPHFRRRHATLTPDSGADALARARPPGRASLTLDLCNLNITILVARNGFPTPIPETRIHDGAAGRVSRDEPKIRLRNEPNWSFVFNKSSKRKPNSSQGRRS